MGLDSYDDDEEGGEDPDSDSIKHTPRAPRNIIKRESLPSVESSLDRFIEKANEKLVDVSGFQSASKEETLQKEVDELKEKLADAELRAEQNRRSPWGRMILSFAVGCASVFAVSFAMPKDKTTTATTQAPPAQVEPPHVATPSEPAQPAPTPPAAAPEPAPTAAATEPAPEPAPVETPPTQTAVKADTHAKKTTPKRTPKREPTTTTRTQPTPPPATEPAKGSGAGSDLYNPF